MSSNLDPDLDYASLTLLLRHAFEQLMKGINTCLPGFIVDYDPATRRAKVQAALPLLTTEDNLVDWPIIANVPVVFPSGGGYSLLFPLESGEPVLLAFAQRGIREFKKRHQRAAPEASSFFSEKDAIAIAGFGPPPSSPIAPVSSQGVVLQDNSGTTFVALEAEGVRIETTGTLTLRASRINLEQV